MATLFGSRKNRRLSEEEAVAEASKTLRDELNFALGNAENLTRLSGYLSDEELDKAVENLNDVESSLKAAAVAVKTLRRNLK